ncbi:protein DPCD-like [Clavelina lepadiformis]|uniref:protein DPCD-like n=1 Tax=Clavelina lepadiformis TaxID=159417 RepID=UPI004042983A
MPTFNITMSELSPWVETLKSARKTALIQDGRRKIHFTLSDGTELCEEYEIKTNDLVVRKWRRKSTLGGVKAWELEVGESDLASGMSALSLGTQQLIESNSNPVCIRRDTRRAFQWRIRNLPYPLTAYQVTVDDDKHGITIRTSNKKYFKKLTIPDMERSRLVLDSNSLTFAHANNTLIVQYKKPKAIVDDQEVLLEEFKKMKSTKDGDVECNQS